MTPQVGREVETCVLNLRTHDHTGIAKKRAVRIFSVPRGALKLCMLSTAPNRTQVYDEILDVFDRYRFGSMLKSFSSQQPIAVTGPYIKNIQRIMGRTKANAIIKSLFAGTFDYNEYFMTLEEIARLPDGLARRAAVEKEAQRIGHCTNTVYRNVDKVRRTLGLQGISRKNKGQPRRMRADKGSHRQHPEYQAVMAFIAEHPEYTGKGNQHKNFPKKDIRKILGLSVSASRICAWLREGKSIH